MAMKNLYKVVSLIPILGTVIYVAHKKKSGKSEEDRPFMFCSMGLDEGTYDDLIEYMKDHPGVKMTEKLAEEIRSKNREQCSRNYHSILTGTPQ